MPFIAIVRIVYFRLAERFRFQPAFVCLWKIKSFDKNICNGSTVQKFFIVEAVFLIYYYYIKKDLYEF